MGDRRPKPFHERFDIEVGVEEARRRFVNRTFNVVFDPIPSTLRANRAVLPAGFADDVYRHVASALGERYAINRGFKDYTGNRFDRCLQVLEALYDVLQGTGLEEELSGRISKVIDSSEIDLGVSWKPPIFVPTGARLLDDRLINDPLDWLSDPKYATVREPFAKGMSHFLETEQKPQLLPDVITDMYEALEAMAKIITGRPNRDLSANRDAFVSKVGASEQYKRLLKEYIAYANNFRHAAWKLGARPKPSRAEVESFIYMTGLFIRLAIRQPE